MGLTENNILKSRFGRYKDNAENRRLHRVGLPYGKQSNNEEKRGNEPSAQTLKEWKKREERLGQAAKSISSVQEYEGDEKREELREDLISKVVATATRHFDEPKAIFCLGGAASGKSSSLRKLGYDETVIPCQLNPDNFQEGELQGDNMFYNWTDSKSGASRLHKETSNMTKEAYKRVLGTGGDFVKDGVMGDYEKAMKDIQAAIDAGYEPEIVGVALDTEEAVKRSALRYEKAESKEKFSGRWVPENVLRDGHFGASNTLARIIIEHPELKVKLFDNNVAFGEDPILIYNSQNKPPILNNEKFLNFIGKGSYLDRVKEYFNMKNDFAKSILDNPYNKDKSGVGLHIDLLSVLSKYAQQRGGYSCSDLTSYAEDTGRSEEYYIEYRAWMNDGKPTGIESDEQFYELQKQAYGRILVNLDK